MEWLKWQRSLLNDFKDLDVLEVITVRGAGKTWGGLAWVCEDSDEAVFITRHKNKIKELYKELGLKAKKLHIITNLNQLDKIPTHPKKKLKIVVDDYFLRPEIGINELDEKLGHENYKVLFIGSRSKKEDKYKIPYSKQLHVDIMHLFADKVISVDQLKEIVSNLSEERLKIEFGTPFESN